MALPPDGPGYEIVRVSRDRFYSHPATIAFVERLGRRAAAAGLAPFYVGDLSQPRGGPTSSNHVSHQNGLDVDIYFPRLDHRLVAPVAHDQIDRRLSQDLVDRFVATGAQMVFVGFGTGLRGPSGVVIPYAGHDYHMHVRFRPSRG